MRPGPALYDAKVNSSLFKSSIGSLNALIMPVSPFHPAVRLMSHPYASTFALTSMPDAIITAADCASRARNERVKGELRGYGKAFGMNIRFRTESGDAPILRLLWTKDRQRLAHPSCDVEQP